MWGMKPRITIIPKREDVVPEKRRQLSLKEKLDLMAKHPHCPLCHGKLGPIEGLQFDHTIARGLGGTQKTDDFRPMHINCHVIKTAEDKKRMAKANRIRKREAGEEGAPSRKIPSRPFPKRKKNDRKTKRSSTRHDQGGESDAEPEEG